MAGYSFIITQPCDNSGDFFLVINLIFNIIATEIRTVQDNINLTYNG